MWCTRIYIHDAQTNETRWATEEDLVDVAHDEENVRTTSSFRNHEKMIVETQLKKNENGEDVQKSDKQLERPKAKGSGLNITVQNTNNSTYMTKKRMSPFGMSIVRQKKSILEMALALVHSSGFFVSIFVGSMLCRDNIYYEACHCALVL